MWCAIPPSGTKVLVPLTRIEVLCWALILRECLVKEMQRVVGDFTELVWLRGGTFLCDAGKEHRTRMSLTPDYDLTCRPLKSGGVEDHNAAIHLAYT